MELALDTSTGLGSVAVGVGDGHAVARCFLRRQGAHASELVPAIDEVLERAGASRSEIEGVVAGAGPGSFTGVRVAAATAKGLVRALGVPLRAVSSLAGAALTAELEIPDLGTAVVRGPERTRPRHVLFDAGEDRVYAASYRIEGGRIEEEVPPRAALLGQVLEESPDPESLFCGAGARRHRERIEAAGFRVLPAPAGVPTADALLRILVLEPPPATVERPGRWEPDYLRAWTPGP